MTGGLEEILTTTGEYIPGAPDGGVSYNWCKEVMTGLHDPEPDMFNFSGPGISGKFFYDQLNNIHTAPVQPLKISLVTGNGWGFRVVNEKGVTYEFLEYELSFSSSGSSNYNWYLSKIITPERDTVMFEYERLSYKYRTFFGQSRVKYIAGFYDVKLISQAGDIVVNHNVFDSVTVNGSRLKSIKCNNGTSIDFTYAATPRLDLPGTNALTAISVFYGSSLKKKFSLVQEYIGNTSFPDQNRMRLTQVSEQGTDGSVTAPYKFFYNDTRSLPARLSNAQDHWGYYNGKGGNHRFPRNSEYWKDDINSVDREQDTSYSKAGLMTAMQYPTGGTVTFDYEPNDIWVQNEQSITTTYDGAGCGGVPFTTTERLFTIPVKAMDKRIAYNTYAQYVDPLDNPPVEDPTCNISIRFPDGHYEYVSGINSKANGDPVTWPPGDYKVTVETFGDNSRAFFSITYEVKDTTYYTGNRTVGGWRLRKTNYKDPFHPAKNKVLTYAYIVDDALPGKSSGVMPSSKPKYEYFRTPAMYKIYKKPGGPAGGDIYWAEYKSCVVVVQSVNSLSPLWSDHGHIFYPTVSVLDGENGENGKTVYHYSYDNPGSGYFGYPFTPGINVDWFSGLLQKKEEFRKNGNGTFTLLRSTENKYSIAPDSFYWRHFYSTPEPVEALKGIGLAVAQLVPEITIDFVLYPAKFDAIPYHYLSRWLKLDTTFVTLYTGNQGESIQTATIYNYANGLSLQPTEIKSENSKKELSRIVNTYPNDYRTIPIYQKMLQRNIVSPVIEEKRYNGNNLLVATKTNYGLTSSDLALPASVERALFNNSADTEMVYSRYDDRGNMLEYRTKDGVSHAFIWGYNKKYPVAAIQGSDYNTAIALLANPAILNTGNDQQIRNELNNIRTGLASQKAMVSTYTYLPLVGITSATDPAGKTTYYEYDGLSRLKMVKDQNGKILKQFDYQYQQPLTQ